MRNKFAVLLWILLIVIIILSSIIAIKETNIFFRQKNSITTKNFYLNSFVDKSGSGILVLKRVDNTPLGLEYVSFDNGETYKFFALNEDEVYKDSIVIDIPKNAENGRYFVKLEASIEGETYDTEISFRIG